MTRQELINYIKTTERMISPEQVAKVNQFSSLLGKLPLKWQKGIAAKGAVKNPYMGFVVEPYSYFLSYEIKDMEWAERMMPEGYRIVSTSIFADTEPRPSVIIGAFNVHTSVFWGSRVELYIIAENVKSGLLSWIIADYESSTNSFDPGQGFISATASRSVVTTSHRGDIIVDMEGTASHNRLSLVSNIREGRSMALNQRLWVEGNLSVDYGGELADGNSDPFALIFDPMEMESALRIPMDRVDVAINSFCEGVTEKKPYEAACFPFAQHFVTTSIPVGMNLKNGDDLEKAVVEFPGEPKKKKMVS